MTVLLHYQAQPVATVGRTRAYLLPHIEGLPDGHPTLRFVVLMCAYALEVAEGRLPGPYSDERAAFFARSALLGDDEISKLSLLSDIELARHFGVPVEQVVEKRRDLARDGLPE